MTVSTSKRQHWLLARLPRAGSLGMSARFVPHVSLVLLLALLVWASTLQLRTPDVAPESAPATDFSAARAMEDLRAFAVEPRPIGSTGHLATQRYLVAQIESLGLVAEVQTTTVVVESETGEGFGAGTVTNILTRVPGAASTGAIVINAHYDGGSTGPAASDNGAGVVVALETLRAVVAGEGLRNDLIIVFADGEENGMLGAAAFVQQHPWAQDVRLAINSEAQGTGGPAMLYATSEENSWLVREFLDVVPHASAYSLMPEIGWLVPGARLECDLGEYTAAGIPGFGFVYAHDTPAYHTILDNTDRIDPGSVQQEGDATLALVQHFGRMDLNVIEQSGNRVFFNILPGTVVHYPYSFALPLAALVTVLVALLAVVGVRRDAMTLRGLVGGTFAFFGATLLTVLLTGLTWFAIRTLNSDYQVRLIGSYQSTLYVVALTFASVAIMATLYLLLRRKVSLLNLATGVLLGGTLVLWFTSVTVPGISYIVAWPLLFGILPVAWILLVDESRQRVWARMLVLSVAAMPAILILPGTLYQIVGLVNRFEGLTGFPLVGITMLFVAPLAGLFLLHLDMLEELTGGRRWVIPAVAAAVAIALIGWGNATSGFDAEQPRPNQIAYYLDADTAQASWVSYDTRLDDWTAQFFPANPERSDPGSRLFDGMTGYVGPAPVAAVHQPEIVVLEDTVNGTTRSLVLTVTTAPGGGHMQIVELEAQGAILAASVKDQPLDVVADLGAPDGELTVAYVNSPDAGWTLAVTVESTAPVAITIEDATYGLPEIPGTVVTPQPDDMMPAPGLLDPTLVKRTFVY